LDFKPEYSWEFLSQDEIQAKTLRALRNHIRHAKEVSPYYKELLWDITPEDIKSFEDFQHVPFTGKTSLAEHNHRFLGCDPGSVVETVVTSGSTGKPVHFALTSNDLERLAFNEALSFHSIGIHPGDTAQILVSLDRLFIAGMAYYRGLTLLGANTMRIGVLPFEMQKHYIETFSPTVLVGVPSFIKKLGQELAKTSFDTVNCSVKNIICIGESLRTQDMALNSVGRSIMEIWGAKVFSTYASTEMSVSYCECSEQLGGHAHPELVYTEIVDESGKPVPDGTPGELVATPLGVEGMPLIRYRTGDITFSITQPCACGRNSMRIGPILGRKSQMIKLKGTTVYPLAITNALDEIEEINDYIIILENDDSLSDRVAIHVATTPASVEKISNRLRAVARVNFPVLVSNIATIQSLRGASRKKIRILDWRQQVLGKSTSLK
jgi:phenylacetate-CoA ligase